MTRSSYLLSILAGYMIWYPAAAALADEWCVPTTAPSITVRPSTDEISYNFSLSEKQLDHFDITTVSPYANNIITDVGGLMKGGIETRQKMNFGILTNQTTGQVCFWHDSIDVLIHIKPTIYVASEFPEGSCMHNAILEHEQKHVTVDREIVNKYAQLIGKALEAEISRYRIYGPVSLSQQPALESQLKTRIQSLIGAYTAQMSEERRNRQQQIDNLEEYERVNHVCPNKNHHE